MTKRQPHILVIGDVCVDGYHKVEVRYQHSPEHSAVEVPVYRIVENTASPGMAANVAMNVIDLGAKCTLIGSVGVYEYDEHSEWLSNEVQRAGIRPYLMPNSDSTTFKLRYIDQDGRPINRIDYDSEVVVDLEIESNLIPRNLDAIIVSDYNKGVVTERLMQRILDISETKRIPVIANPKPQNIGFYYNVDTVIVNSKEFREIVGEASISVSEEAVRELMNHYAWQTLIITDGWHGLYALSCSEKEMLSVEALKVEEKSVVGAGDTVIAMVALAQIKGYEFKDVVRLANTAAGLKVTKEGTSTVSWAEVVAYQPA
jgi:rfaE bifunctional protein kinase chain/domain